MGNHPELTLKATRSVFVKRVFAKRVFVKRVFVKRVALSVSSRMP